jgi:hypothetical protein
MATCREILEQLKELSEEQLDMEFLVYDDMSEETKSCGGIEFIEANGEDQLRDEIVLF